MTRRIIGVPSKMYEKTSAYKEYFSYIGEILSPYMEKPTESFRKCQIFNIPCKGYNIVLAIKYESFWLTEKYFEVILTINETEYEKFLVEESFLFFSAKDLVANLLVQLIPITDSIDIDIQSFLNKRIMEDKLSSDFTCWYKDFMFHYFSYNGKVGYGTLNKPLIFKNYSSENELIDILADGFKELYTEKDK